MQLQELNNRFSESSAELLLCMSCLNPSDSFRAYDERKLICLAELYPSDFSIIEVIALKNQLAMYIIDMRTSEEFSSLRSIVNLAKQIVKFKKNDVYPLVYKLITLALTLPVSTITVERAFLAMKIIKHRLRSRMGDDWLNDCLVPYIEKDVFEGSSSDIRVVSEPTETSKRMEDSGKATAAEESRTLDSLWANQENKNHQIDDLAADVH
ncbi:uncharacterized protein LOC110116457 [Dendrobium catenatum]|uniref:uncharacterized protein LOC110116457 n=1 Tax=Dendrobium catenatum TaxID=906689 RepID=UPI0009F188C9|nr:uncharacterized protein LOC110116457 [Dendrobium catenatum]